MRNVEKFIQVNVPVVVNANGNDNASCPRCGHYNALLGNGNYDGENHRTANEFHECRDCGYECFVKYPERDK